MCRAVSRVALVKPEKAQGIENMLLGAARRGAIKDKVNEEGLIALLQQVSEQTEKKTKVSILRRRSALDDSDDDDDDW